MIDLTKQLQHENHVAYQSEKIKLYNRFYGRRRTAESAYRLNRISWPELVVRRKYLDEQYDRQKATLRKQYNITKVPKAY